MTTTSTLLTPEQLTLHSKIDNMQLAYKTAELNPYLLLPQLSQFVSRVIQADFDVYMLATHYPVKDYLGWLGLSFFAPKQTASDELLGYFATEPNHRVAFKPGLLFTTNNQTILIDANDLLQDSKLLDIVGKVIRNRHLSSRWLMTEDTSNVTHNKYRHQKLKFDKQIIITGDYEAIQNVKFILPSLSKLTCDEITEADQITELKIETVTAFNHFMTYYISQHKLEIDLSIEQTQNILWALARLIEEQSWFSLDLSYLKRLLSRLPKHFIASDVELAVQDINGFNSSSRLYNFEQILKNTIKVDFSGEVIGQINGLTVVETALAEFGEPSRITANIFVGEGDIGDIERKSDLGGNIHAKAMMILSSFVARVFAKNIPLPISSNIVFEQSYHEIDGDSASLAELYALLSAISNVPIKQNVALTGAIDQLGNVLAVGGIDLKIEGYYVLAKLKSPSQVHHVIIPHANIGHLNLSSEILNAVSQGSLQIHAIKHVNEAAHLLTGLPAESETEVSLFDKVREELEHYGQELEHSRSFFKKLALFFRKSG
ncbi:S16 family serine protease [Catenovulum adriaticum]|uniref:endopeptidase La n=1 Tax=Catenovulum adriaticum TaxID=2984846 RepID=A0ABY7AP90_9ALTE|nr:S16 family serine protease [Catenovulum sp. TS8]WAJ71388.1 hypothetical protein OLW01_06215 [Catenovulum sp. TS8]